MKELCQVEDCKSVAKYALYKTFSDGMKKWLHVCRWHEQKIGSENLKRARGYFKERSKAERLKR